MYRRLKYLLAEGFTVSMITGPDHWEDVHFTGVAKITYTARQEDGKMRLHSEEHEVTPGEWRQCADLFLRAKV